LTTCSHQIQPRAGNPTLPTKSDTFCNFRDARRPINRRGSYGERHSPIFFDAQSAQRSDTAPSETNDLSKIGFVPSKNHHPLARHSHGAAIRHFRQNPTLFAIFRDPPAVPSRRGCDGKRHSPFFRCTKCTKIRYGPFETNDLSKIGFVPSRNHHPLRASQPRGGNPTLPTKSDTLCNFPRSPGAFQTAGDAPANATRLFFSMHKVHKNPIRPHSKQTTCRKLASFRLKTITQSRGTAAGRQSDTSDKIRHSLQFSAIPRRFQTARKLPVSY